MIHDVMIAMIGWVLLLPLLYCIGSFARPWLMDLPPNIRGIYFFAIGYGAIAVWMLFAGSVGMLDQFSFAWSAVIVVLLRVRVLSDFYLWSKGIVRFLFSDNGVFIRIVQLLTVLALLITFIPSCLPEISNDALTYQLNLPKAFLRQLSVMPLEFDLNSYTPLLMNMLYLLGLLFKSVALAKIFHWFAGFLLFMMIAFLVHELTGKKAQALLAGVLFLATPTIMNQISTTYVDVGVALFVFLFIYRLVTVLKDAHLSRGKLLVCGFLLGAGVGAKVLVMMGWIPVLIILIFHGLEHKSFDRFFKSGLFLLLGFLSVTGYWWVRNYWLTGNPLFPYLGSLFGAEDFGFVSHFQDAGPPKSLLGFILNPFHLVFKPDFYDRGHWLGPMYLILIPLVVYGCNRSKRCGQMGIFALLYFSIWYVLFSNVRFLTPLLPIMIVSGFYGGVLCLEKLPKVLRGMLMGLLFLAVLALVGLGGYHYRYQWRLASGQWTEDQYLANMERSWPIAKWVNENTEDYVRIFNAEENRQYYFNRDMVRSVWFERKFKEIGSMELDALHQLLEKNLFTHILITGSGDDESESDMKKNLRRFTRDSTRARLLVAMDSENIREPKVHYELYEIEPRTYRKLNS